MWGGTWAGALTLSLTTGLGAVAVAPAEADPEERHRATAKVKPPKPTVSKVKPASGLTSGNTLVTIKGDHLTGAKKVLFGKAKGTSVKVKSDRKLTVVAPAQTSGAVDIRVKTKGGKSKKVSKARFTYLLAPPTVTALATTSGPYVGGTRVTVTGTDFEQVTGVTFGGTPGTGLSVLSPTQLAVTTPAHEAGAVPMVVTTSAGSATAATQFSFVAVPSAVQATIPATIPLGPTSWSDLSYLACSTPPLCVVVGRAEDASGEVRPLVQRRTAPGQWVATELPLPADAAANGDPDFWDLDCGSPTLCAAVGYYSASVGERAMAITWNGSTWSAQAITMPTLSAFQSDVLSGVDCPTSTTCVAVGRYSDDATGDDVSVASTFNGSTWSAGLALPTPASTDDARLEAVDCLAATQCVAVGDRRAASQSLPYLVTLSGGTWTPVTIGVPAGASADPDGILEEVSCVVDGVGAQCVAVGTFVRPAGRFGFLARLASGGGSWASSDIPTPGPAEPNPRIDVVGVTCVTSTECRAVGDFSSTTGKNAPLMVHVASGIPASVDGPVPTSSVPSPGARVGHLACRTTTSCLAVGAFESGTDWAPYVQTLGPGGWTAAPAPLPAGAIYGGLFDVAHMGTNGVMTGWFDAPGNLERGLLIELPPAA